MVKERAGSVVELRLSEILGNGGAFREDGLKVRRRLERAWKKTRQFHIDMAGLKGASPSFMDEAFAKLFLKYPRAEITRKLIFSDLTDYHRHNLNDLVDIRLRQRQQAAAQH